jgi:hypothetical protein
MHCEFIQVGSYPVRSYPAKIIIRLYNIDNMLLLDTVAIYRNNSYSFTHSNYGYGYQCQIDFLVENNFVIIRKCMFSKTMGCNIYELELTRKALLDAL